MVAFDFKATAQAPNMHGSANAIQMALSKQRAYSCLMTFLRETGDSFRENSHRPIRVILASWQIANDKR
jgi:hypothetical protein